jgi:Icc-related predicted phosphoesterase
MIIKQYQEEKQQTPNNRCQGHLSNLLQSMPFENLFVMTEKKIQNDPKNGYKKQPQEKIRIMRFNTPQILW